MRSFLRGLLYWPCVFAVPVATTYGLMGLAEYHWPVWLCVILLTPASTLLLAFFGFVTWFIGEEY